jgi:hypothetical protein
MTATLMNAVVMQTILEPTAALQQHCCHAGLDQDLIRHPWIADQVRNDREMVVMPDLIRHPWIADQVRNDREMAVMPDLIRHPCLQDFLTYLT